MSLALLVYQTQFIFDTAGFQVGKYHPDWTVRYFFGCFLPVLRVPAC